MSSVLLPRNEQQTAALVRTAAPEYTKLAAAAFPTPAASEAGVVLENTDTGDRFVWTGTDWVQYIAAGECLVKAAVASVARDTSASATLSAGIAVSTTASVLVAASNSTRKFISVSNSHATLPVWIKLQAAAVDNAQKGILLPARETFNITGDPMYTGEVSAIASSSTQTVYATQY